MPAEVSRNLNARIPVAKPALHALDLHVRAADPKVEAPVLTVETLKGWASSVALHVLLLLAMAFWYFAPKRNGPPVLDTRLAGSDMGVAEGTSLTGGLNAEQEHPFAPVPVAEPIVTFKPLDVNVVDALGVRSGNGPGDEKPTAGGGLDSNNPGAGNGDGFGLARFGSGGENIRGVSVKVGDPQFTLLWDTDIDLDLHVVEPGGKEIYWEEPRGKEGLGGELDVDNTKGFGPENIYWLQGEGDDRAPGPGPPGEYRWFVVYWGGFGGPTKPTRWKVRIKHDGKVTIVNGKLRRLGEKSKVYTLKLEPRSAAATETP